MIRNVKENIISDLRGGKGNVSIRRLLDNLVISNSNMIALIELEPYASIGEHYHHDDSEIYYIVEGKGIFNDNGEEFDVKKGDFCNITKGMKHGLINNSGEKLVLLAIVYDEMSEI